MILTQARYCADAVEPGHVEVDDDRLRRELLDELDRLQAVRCDTDDGQLRLLIDQRLYGFHERLVVVDEDDVDRPLGGTCPQFEHAGRH